MTDQLVASTIRGAYGALVTGLLTLLLTYQTAGDWTVAGVAAGVSALSYLAARGGVEGVVDSRREAIGAISSSDVGAFSQPIRRSDTR